MKVGNAPVDLGAIELDPVEMMFCQYLPVRMPSSDFRFPANVQTLRRLLPFVAWGEQSYVYLTVKNLYVSALARGRPGWHLDGFGTDDTNYIWYDSAPTEFCVQSFDISDDCDASARELTAQANGKNIRTYAPKHLLRLTPQVVHRVSTDRSEGYRCFVKISVSNDRYDLRGNAHNYLFDYDWSMSARDATRNHPAARMKAAP